MGEHAVNQTEKCSCHYRSWEVKMQEAIQSMLADPLYASAVSSEHTKDTPKRVVKAFKEYFSGCSVSVQEILRESLFPSDGYQQMIHVREILFHSTCAHHLAQISGKVHFAYIPDHHIIGLSKIPRLVEAIAHRPQVQELISEQIVNMFTYYVKPIGCGVMIRASHSCMQCRGVRSQTSITDTLALRGSFLANPPTREEFITAVYSGVQK